MDDVFLKLVNLSISASWLILAVLVLRVVLKKRRSGSCRFFGAWSRCGSSARFHRERALAHPECRDDPK